MLLISHTIVLEIHWNNKLCFISFLNGTFDLIPELFLNLSYFTNCLSNISFWSEVFQLTGVW